jgi:hypothetical protein
MSIHPYTRLFVLPSAPTVDEDESEGYEVGDVVISGGSIYDCTDNAEGAAVWQERVADGIPASYLDTDGTLAANSDAKIASQKATKTYVDTAVTGLLDFKGATDCSTLPNYPPASKGDAYVVSVVGKIGGASGKAVDTGDVFVASADNAGGTEAAVGTSWFVLEHNLQGVLLAANNLSELTDVPTARNKLGLGGAALLNVGTGSGDVAAGDRGVTNGDNHDHNGGDGNQIAYSSLSGTPAAETNGNVICSVSAPGGASAFAGTIATLPGGAPTTLTYNVTSGQEGAMKPTGSTQLAKMRLYNTTRGTSALISDVNTGTNTITLTANVPAGWAVTDVITIASQTVTGGGYSWVDMEIASGPTGRSSLFFTFLITSGAAGDETVLHPLATYGGSKRAQLMAQVAAVQANGFGLVPITNNVFSWAWTANSTVITVREAGYLP